MKQQFDVTGMTCSACSAHVEKAVAKINGVKKVSVNLIANSMVVTYDEKVTDTDKIIGAVSRAGYGAAVKDGRDQSVKPAKKVASGVTLSRLITSIVICVVLMYVAMEVGGKRS